MVKKVKAMDLATKKMMLFSPNYRYSVDPEFMRVPPYSTVEEAFESFSKLKDAPVGASVFIEWCGDCFYRHDEKTDEFVPGPRVWRLSEVLGHIDVTPKEQHDE